MRQLASTPCPSRPLPSPPPFPAALAPSLFLYLSLSSVLSRLLSTGPSTAMSCQRIAQDAHCLSDGQMSPQMSRVTLGHQEPPIASRAGNFQTASCRVHPILHEESSTRPDGCARPTDTGPPPPYPDPPGTQTSPRTSLLFLPVFLACLLCCLPPITPFRPCHAAQWNLSHPPDPRAWRACTVSPPANSQPGGTSRSQLRWFSSLGGQGPFCLAIWAGSGKLQLGRRGRLAG